MSRSHRFGARVLGAALALCLLVPAGSAMAQDATIVDMQGISFVPKEIHVAPGATIVWMNSSPLAHTVTADDGSWDLGNVDPGENVSTTFDSPGTYAYYCQPHGGPGGVGMAGTIVVDDPAAIEEITAPMPALLPRNANPDQYTPAH